MAAVVTKVLLRLLFNFVIWDQSLLHAVFIITFVVYYFRIMRIQREDHDVDLTA